MILVTKHLIFSSTKRDFTITIIYHDINMSQGIHNDSMVDILEYINIETCQSEFLLDKALKLGMINVDRIDLDTISDPKILSWWVTFYESSYNPNFRLVWTSRSMDDASSAGNIPVLEWWKQSGLTLMYQDSMDYASKNGHIDVLDWWVVASGLKLKYTIDAMATSNIDVLNWWRNSGLELRFYREAETVDEYYSFTNPVDQCTTTEELDWWFSSGINFTWTCNSMDLASANGRTEILDWWLNSSSELKYSSGAIDMASAGGHIDTLNWWVKSGLELEYSCGAINYASIGGHVDTLDWWVALAGSSGIELRWDKKAMDLCSYVNVLDWWVNSGLDIKYSNQAILRAQQDGDHVILSWWLQFGLELP